MRAGEMQEAAMRATKKRSVYWPSSVGRGGAVFSTLF